MTSCPRPGESRSNRLGRSKDRDNVVEANRNLYSHGVDGDSLIIFLSYSLSH